jgi:NTP pyrophosphatase (non-canonical NTP hydrolase)
MTLTFEHLTHVSTQRTNRWHRGFPNGTSDWNGGDWGNALAGETGEACNVIKKIRRLEEGFAREDSRGRDELLAALARELADVVIYADLTCTYHGFPLGPWVAKKFNETSVKWGFPERLPEWP